MINQIEGVCDLYPFESKTVGTATINKFEVDRKSAFGFNLDFLKLLAIAKRCIERIRQMLYKLITKNILQ